MSDDYWNEQSIRSARNLQETLAEIERDELARISKAYESMDANTLDLKPIKSHFSFLRATTPLTNMPLVVGDDEER